MVAAALMKMSKLNPPETFDFSKPQLWEEWKKRFKRYRIASKLNKEDGEVQVSTIIIGAFGVYRVIGHVCLFVCLFVCLSVCLSIDFLRNYYS